MKMQNGTWHVRGQVEKRQKPAGLMQIPVKKKQTGWLQPLWPVQRMQNYLRLMRMVAVTMKNATRQVPGRTIPLHRPTLPVPSPPAGATPSPILERG
jgi:hypothetical protein